MQTLYIRCTSYVNKTQYLHVVIKYKFPLESLRKSLTKAPIVQCSDFNESKLFRLQTDASRTGLEAVLSNENEQVVAYSRHNFKPVETIYPVIEF